MIKFTGLDFVDGIDITNDNDRLSVTIKLQSPNAPDLSDHDRNVFFPSKYFFTLLVPISGPSFIYSLTIGMLRRATSLTLVLDHSTRTVILSPGKNALFSGLRKNQAFLLENRQRLNFFEISVLVLR